MRVFATFDADGRRVGTYPDDIYPDEIIYGAPPVPTDDDPDPAAPIVGHRRNAAVPEAAIEISAEQWRDLVENPDTRRWDGAGVVDYTPPPPPLVVPDNPTLGDWRVGLSLWRRPDGTSRLADVLAAIAALIAAGHPLGEVVFQRVEYSNNVLRAELMQLKDALGFSAEEVDESLYRARQVSCGDLSGVWPLPG